MTETALTKCVVTAGLTVVLWLIGNVALQTQYLISQQAFLVLTGLVAVVSILVSVVIFKEQG